MACALFNTSTFSYPLFCVDCVPYDHLSTGQSSASRRESTRSVLPGNHVHELQRSGRGLLLPAETTTSALVLPLSQHTSRINTQQHTSTPASSAMVHHCAAVNIALADPNQSLMLPSPPPSDDITMDDDFSIDSDPSADNVPTPYLQSCKVH